LVFYYNNKTYKELVYALIAKRKKYRVDTMAVSQMIGVADSSVGDWERMKKSPNGMTSMSMGQCIRGRHCNEGL